MYPLPFPDRVVLDYHSYKRLPADHDSLRYHEEIAPISSFQRQPKGHIADFPFHLSKNSNLRVQYREKKWKFYFPPRKEKRRVEKFLHPKNHKKRCKLLGGCMFFALLALPPPPPPTERAFRCAKC